MGQSKAWLPFHDEPMLARVVGRLANIVDPVIVVAAVAQDLPPLPAHVAVVRDAAEDRGPLQGLAAGLAALPETCEAAYLSGCDAPLLAPAFVRRLAELIGEAWICVPQVGERLHPLAAVYRRQVAVTADRLLAAGRLKMTDLLHEAPTRIVTAAELADVDPIFETLRNVNTRADYEAALQAAAPPQLCFHPSNRAGYTPHPHTFRDGLQAVAATTHGSLPMTAPFASTFSWNELATTDTAAASKFYTELLGWTTESVPMAHGTYTIFSAGGKKVGGMLAMGPEWGDIKPHWMPYISVPDVDAAAKRIGELGGKVLVPPTDIPNVGRFSVFQDPTGGHCSVIKFLAEMK
jgi:molybdopterin-guanine dinucleotide biosynthesis protein A